MLTIGGWLAFVLYAALRTGSADTWFRAQRGGWSDSFDAGVHFVYEIGAFLTPLSKGTHTVTYRGIFDGDLLAPYFPGGVFEFEDTYTVIVK